MTEVIKNSLINNENDIFIKNNDIYINIPKELLNKDNKILTDYIRIYTATETLKKYINDYLFDNHSKINQIMIVNQIFKIKKEENLSYILPFLDIDIDSLEDKLKNLCAFFSIDEKEIETKKESTIELIINSKENLESIIDKDYVNEIIDYIQNEPMYSLKEKSRYGVISKGYNIKLKDDIKDLNQTQKNGKYSPILVIYRPAKYERGTYILDDNYYVYIKRQPLDALIKQEELDIKGADYMGAITYKKLKHDLSNENLQELLAELYVYAKKNALNFNNIKLADIGDNKVWMTGDKLKKEFKELRYYHKNLTQKIKEIYDSKGSYYTQIGGKYVYNARDFLSSYKTYKDKEINSKK